MFYVICTKNILLARFYEEEIIYSLLTVLFYAFINDKIIKKNHILHKKSVFKGLDSN